MDGWTVRESQSRLLVEVWGWPSLSLESPCSCHLVPDGVIPKYVPPCNPINRSYQQTCFCIRLSELLSRRLRGLRD